MPEYVRAIAQRRLGERPLGTADPETLDAVEWWVTNVTSEA